jgi:uncharacterized protein YjbI with pentapeptide repeats
MARQVGTTGSTVWMTDDDPDGPVTTVYPEGEPTKVRLLGSVIAMSNGAFRPVAQTAAVGQTLPGEEYLRRRNLWNDPGSGQFKRRGWSSLKALAARLLDGTGVRDDAREKGSITARLRNDRFTNVGLSAGDVVTVRYEDDDFGRIVVTRDTGRTRSYRVPWDQLAPFDGPSGQDEQSLTIDTTPIGEVASEALPISSPPSLSVVVPERSDPAAARAEALRLLEQLPDDPFDVPHHSDQLSTDDRARLDVILQAGAVLLGDLRAEQTAARRRDASEYWSDAALDKRQRVAERQVNKARERFIALQQELVETVVNETNSLDSVPPYAVLPEGPFTIRDGPDDTDLVSVEFEDANGSVWRVQPVLNHDNKIHGWRLAHLVDHRMTDLLGVDWTRPATGTRPLPPDLQTEIDANPDDGLQEIDLSGRDLSGVDLSGYDLRRANLNGAILTGANLTGANLQYADLRDADLIGADLIGANLYDAKLGKANLSGADLTDAKLGHADLVGTTLIGVDLTKTSDLGKRRPRLLFPLVRVAQGKKQNEAAKLGGRAAKAAEAVRSARALVRAVEAERQNKATFEMHDSPTDATAAFVDALQDSQSELWGLVTAVVQTGDVFYGDVTDPRDVEVFGSFRVRTDKMSELIGQFDPRRPIEVRPLVRPTEQTVLLPTITASGQERLVSMVLHRSSDRQKVRVGNIAVFDNSSTRGARPKPLAHSNMRYSLSFPNERLGVAVDDWFTWKDAERVFVDRDMTTFQSVTRAWAAEGLAAGATPSVVAITDFDREIATWVEASGRVIPAALVEAINDRAGPVRVSNLDSYQSLYRESEYTVVLASEGAALHEYGHVLEYRIPALNRMIWAFYQHRTEGEALTELRHGLGASRTDWFFDAYAGRDYGSGTKRNPADRIGREVFTTGLESLFLDKRGPDRLALDDEHAAFVLGALLLASRPGADGVRVRPVNARFNRGFAKGEEVMASPLADTPDVSIDAAMMQVMEAPDWTDRVDEPVRQRAGRARGQWIETATSRHSAPLPDGNRLVVTVDAEVNRRNVRREAIMATGEQGEGLEVRGGAPSGSASWIVIDSEGQIVLSTDPRDELEMQPDETVEAFRERAKQAALEAAVRAKQNDLPSEADLESMSLSELEALFFSLRDNRTVNRNFLYLLRRHIKAKREGTTIDAIQTGPYTYMNRPVLFAEVDASHTTTTRVVAAYSDFGDDLSFPVGFVTWDRNALTLEMVGVQRDARNQGIAQELIRQAMALEPRLRPKDNDARSSDGDALVRSMWPDAAPASRQLSETEAESLAAGMFVQLDVSPESRLQSLPVQSIDMLEVGAPVSQPVAGATIDGIRGRDTMFSEIYTRRGDSWKQAVTKISEQISDDAMDEFAAGMAALLVAEDERRQQRVDNAPASDRLIRGVGQLDLSQTDLSKDSGWSPGDGTIVTTIDPSFTKVGFEKTYKAMIRREDLVPITDDRDGYTTWMAWDDKANLMRVFKVRDDLQQEDGTWKLPSSFTNFGGPVGGANGDDTLGVKRAAAALMRGAWAKSADSVLSYLLREAALEVSGKTKRTLRKLVEAKSGDPDQLAKFDAGVAQVAFMRSLARDVVQAGYADTQRRLAELGINEVTLYRGVADFGGFPDGRGKVTDAPLSSWTADWTVAQYFADLRKYDGISWGTPLVMVRTVPAEQIMGWAGTALGSEDELEVVLLGSEKADTLVMEDYELDDATMEQILPRRAAVVVDGDAVVVDEDWVRVVRRSRGDAVWSAIFDDGVVAHFTNDSWDVVGPEPARTDVETMLGGYLENGWPYQFGGWTDEAFAAGVDPEWMKFRLLGSGARFVLGPVGALGSLRVSTDDVIVG